MNRLTIVLITAIVASIVALVASAVALAGHNTWHTPWKSYEHKLGEVDEWDTDASVYKIRKDGYACFAIVSDRHGEGGRGVSIWCDPYSSPYLRRSEARPSKVAVASSASAAPSFSVETKEDEE